MPLVIHAFLMLVQELIIPELPKSNVDSNDQKRTLVNIDCHQCCDAILDLFTAAQCFRYHLKRYSSKSLCMSNFSNTTVEVHISADS